MDSRPDTRSPFAISGFGLNYCYRYELALNGTKVAVSGKYRRSARRPSRRTSTTAHGVRYQDPDDTACIPTSTLMMLNFVATKGSRGTGFRCRTATTAYSAEESMLQWERTHMTQLTSHPGVDANGWRNGLNYYGWGRIHERGRHDLPGVRLLVVRRRSQRTVQAVAMYNKPVGFLGWAGGHAQIVNGYRVTGLDPATSGAFTVTTIYLTDPLASDGIATTRSPRRTSHQVRRHTGSAPTSTPTARTTTRTAPGRRPHIAPGTGSG